MIIRWICEKDKKKRLYPIEKCIYCKEPVTKVISKKAKVIGTTKVNIPSPLHPIIPYFILLLQDEHGNRLPKKTMKEYKIGDSYELKPTTKEDSVVIMKIKYDVRSYLQESMRLLSSYNLDPGDKILIKVSAIEPAYSYQAVTTNPKILDALILYLKEQGIKDIVVAEQSLIGYDTITSAKKSGILNVCKKHSVDFVDLSKSEFTSEEADEFKFNIAKNALERKMINVPVMKTNSQMGISGAIENLIRLTDTDTQKRMFENNISRTLPQLLKVLPGFLTVGDATIGMQGQGPTSLGEPAFLNMLFISKNPVALDTAFVDMGLLDMPKHIKEAENLGLGSRATEIIGDEIDAIRFNLKPAEKDQA